MNKAVNQQLLDNISIIVKKSLSADATLADLREKKQAGFEAIFKKEAGFICSDNTFQPYAEEVANDYMQWQQTQSKETLIVLVKKIEQLFTLLAQFEKNL